MPRVCCQVLAPATSFSGCVSLITDSFRVRRHSRLLYSRDPGSSASVSLICGRWKYSVLHSKKQLSSGCLNCLGPIFIDRVGGFLSSIGGAGRASFPTGGTLGAGVTLSGGGYSPPNARLYATEAVRRRVLYSPPPLLGPDEDVGRETAVVGRDAAYAPLARGGAG